MSQYYYSPRWTNVVKYLLLTNFFMFVIGFVTGPSLYSVLGLVPKLVWRRGMVWQLFTYMFLHGGFFHFLLNMFLLWMFGSELERHFGSREFLKYYCITGVGAGVLTLLASPHSLIPTVGASGAIYGLLLAYALYFPNRLIYLWFLIPIKAKHLVIFFGIIEFFFALSHAPSGIAHFAHLGGILVGFLYLKTRRRAVWSWLRWKWMHWWASRREEQISDLQREVDRILEKISDQGIESLTEREKQILNRASKLYEGEIK